MKLTELLQKEAFVRKLALHISRQDPHLIWTTHNKELTAKGRGYEIYLTTMTRDDDNDDDAYISFMSEKKKMVELAKLSKRYLDGFSFKEYGPPSKATDKTISYIVEPQ